MQVYRWDGVKKEQMNPLLTRQVIHTEKMTLSRLECKKGCVVPEHSHPNEQISVAESGSMRFVLAGKEVILRAGDTLQIPPNVPHWVEALEDSVGLDIFSPPREDWLRGDDSYLRK
jgi:quercetin dioxygenase-like cupin family protein